MRKIEMEIVDAILNKKELYRGNGRDSISFYYKTSIIYRLWGHTVIIKNFDDYYFSFCGFTTNTTKSRINNLLFDLCGFKGIKQKNYCLYYGNEKIDAVTVYKITNNGIEKTEYKNILDVLHE